MGVHSSNSIWRISPISAVCVVSTSLASTETSTSCAARGTAFDRLFLEYMIRHHEGALVMVADLIATPRAAQDVDVSVLANDVETTQTAEIGLMRQMLLEL